MQRKTPVSALMLVAFLCVAAAPCETWGRGPSVIVISEHLADSSTALSRLIDQMLRSLPLGEEERAQLLLRAAACGQPTSATKTGAQSKRRDAPNQPAVPYTTAVPPGTAETNNEGVADRATSAPAASTEQAKAQPETRAPAPTARDGCLDPTTALPDPAPPSREELERRIKTLIDEQLGYCVRSVQRRRSRIEVRLRRYRVVRQVKVSGNWPIFEEEFLRRLSFRPGQRVPEGPELTRTLASQQDRLKRFLARRGYFEGKLTIRLQPADEAGRVNVDVRIEKGRSHKVGEVRVEPMSLRSPDEAEPATRWEPAVPHEEIEQLFRDHVLFYQRNFNTARCKQHAQELLERYHQRGYPGARIKDDCTKLPKHISGRGVRISLQIQERKRITVQYQGNDHLSAKALNEALTLADAGAYDDYELAESAEQLHKKYQSEGFVQARVRFSRRSLPTRDVVTFHVHEGPRFRVERIEFVGNRAIDDDDLSTVVRTETYPFLGLGEGGYITDVQLAQDARRIADLYQSRGFARVRVSAQIAPHPDLLGQTGALSAAVATGAAAGGDLFIRFTIEEGPRTIVDRVEVTGGRVFANTRLRAHMGLRDGKPFSRRLLEQSRSQLKRLYFENGYPYAEVGISCLKYDQGKRNVELLRLTVRERKPVRFGAVMLRGNFRTRSSVIRSALGLEQGEPFDIRKLERGELKLRKIGVFNSVRIQVLGLQSRLLEVPVLVTVEERYDDYGAIELGFGGSTDNAVFGAIGYNWRNAFGFGANLTMRGEFGPQIQSGNLDALYPRAFGSDFGLELQLFVRNELTERLGPLLTYGGTITVSRELLRDLRALLSYSIRRVETDEPLNRPATDFDESRTAPVNTRTGALSAWLIYDRRDNPLAPSRGYRLAGRFSWASEALFGTDDFLAIRLNAQAYIPLPLDITIAFGLRYDHGIPLAGANLLPRVERFFAGGDTTIRGFEEDRAFAERIESPLAALLDPTLVELLPQGGNIRLLTNLELQFPIWKESWLLGLPLMGAVFIDNGVVGNSFDKFDFADFRHGLGGALRLVTFVGFLSLEYAVPLDPQVGDPRNGRFHINFGFIF